MIVLLTCGRVWLCAMHVVCAGCTASIIVSLLIQPLCLSYLNEWWSDGKLLRIGVHKRVNTCRARLAGRHTARLATLSAGLAGLSWAERPVRRPVWWWAAPMIDTRLGYWQWLWPASNNVDERAVPTLSALQRRSVWIVWARLRFIFVVIIVLVLVFHREQTDAARNY